MFPAKVTNVAVTWMCWRRFLRYWLQRHPSFLITEGEIDEIREHMHRFGKGDIGDESQSQGYVYPPQCHTADDQLRRRQAHPEIELRDDGPNRRPDHRCRLIMSDARPLQKIASQP